MHPVDSSVEDKRAACTGNVVVIMISYLKGREILDLVREGIPVRVGVAVGTRHVQELISGQSVVFVAIAFISMMIISLAWLIFYYVQRFLYTGSRLGSQVSVADSCFSKDSSNKGVTKRHELEGPRLCERETGHRHLQCGAETLSQKQQRGGQGIDVDAENCAVCIENFKVKDVIRILPCKAASGDTEANGQLVDTLSMRKEPEPAVSVNPDASCSSPLCRSLGELEDAQEMPTPESPPRVVLAPELSLTLPDGDRSVGDNSASSPTSHAVPQGDATFKEDASENTVLLGVLNVQSLS
ncbi:e3 ubiquitin-protein ligase RNF149-like protein [Camelus ferus]|nr:e3 ubiquitin-protein ligase RNF149-like protein [Camelus ferus]